MDATGPIPFQAASAYGMRPTGSPRVTASAPTPEAGSPTAVRPVAADRVDLATRSGGLDRLVGGTVRSDINRGIGFDGDPAPPATGPATRSTTGSETPTPRPASSGPFQLYNRHADRLEAATGVALGGSIDIKG